ncbi:MAG: hypothetical protein JWN76_2821 [Chitinophagaceae bacterium]|nr:hypothetical protein [Chitinophagaceae bacterium]
MRRTTLLKELIIHYFAALISTHHEIFSITCDVSHRFFSRLLSIPNPSIPEEQRVYGVKNGGFKVYEVQADTTITSNTKICSAGLLFKIKAAKSFNNIKYYRIFFLEITVNRSATTYKGSHTNFINVDDNGKEFFMKEEDLLTSCALFYNKKMQVAIGFVVNPYVIRFGKKGERPEDNDLGLNVMPALELKKRFSGFNKDIYWGFICGFGVTSANISATQFPGTSLQKSEYATPKNISLISGEVGSFIAIKDAYFAVLLGRPFSPSSLSEWHYYKAATISVGIGVSLFKLSNEGSATTQSSPK